jgi:hypothetical protein
MCAWQGSDHSVCGYQRRHWVSFTDLLHYSSKLRTCLHALQPLGSVGCSRRHLGIFACVSTTGLHIITLTVLAAPQWADCAGCCCFLFVLSGLTVAAAAAAHFCYFTRMVTPQ